MRPFPLCHWAKSGGVTITGFTASIWVIAGTTLTQFDWELTSTDFGGTTYGSGTASSFSSTLTASGVLGGTWDIYSIVVTGLSVYVPSGTSWLYLGNASASGGANVAWGESGGSSSAYYQNISLSIGPTALAGSESFSIQYGGGTIYSNGADTQTTPVVLTGGQTVTDSFTVP